MCLSSSQCESSSPFFIKQYDFFSISHKKCYCFKALWSRQGGLVCGPFPTIHFVSTFLIVHFHFFSWRLQVYFWWNVNQKLTSVISRSLALPLSFLENGTETAQRKLNRSPKSIKFCSRKCGSFLIWL